MSNVGFGVSSEVFDLRSRKIVTSLLPSIKPGFSPYDPFDPTNPNIILIRDCLVEFETCSPLADEFFDLGFSGKPRIFH